MDALLAVPAAVIVATAVFQVRRARLEATRGTAVDLTTPPAPPVDLDFLQARVAGREHGVLRPITSEVSLGARLLAADHSNAATNGRGHVVIHRRRRGEPLVARR